MSSFRSAPCSLRTRAPARWWAGFTTVELAAVILVLSLAAGLAMSAIGGADTQSARTATLGVLRQVRDALVGVDTGRATKVPCFVDDVGRLPRIDRTGAGDRAYSLSELLDGRGVPAYQPEQQRGWRGPYLTAPVVPFGTPDLDLGLVPPQWLHYGQPGDAAVLDGFGRPVLLQVPCTAANGRPDDDDERHARVVSAGPNGRIETPVAARFPSLAACGDDLVVYLRVADLRP